MTGKYQPQQIEPTGATSSQDEVLKEIAEASEAPITESTPATSGLTTQGSAKEIMRQATIANRLEDALSFLRTLSTTRDYFVGYTISDVLLERIKKIGPAGKTPDGGDNDDSPDIMVDGGSVRTDLAKLNKLKVDLLGDPENPDNKGAIKDALELKEKLTKNAPEEGDHAKIDDDGGIV